MAFDPYGLLGVHSSASREEIRQAYRSLARKYHPDVNPSPEAVEHFKEVGMAFAVLNDEPKRALFDEFGEESMHLNFDPVAARQRRQRKARPRKAPPGARARTGRGGPRPRRSGASARRAQPQPQHQQRPQPQAPRHRDRPQPRRGGQPPPEPRPRQAPMGDPRSSDVVAPLPVDLATALSGGQLRIPSPVGGAMLTVRVPAGVQDGFRIRLVGRGRPGRSGAKPGDLHLEVAISRHPHFHFEGDDLVLELPVTMGEAHFGAEVEIPTPDGWLRMRVPPGSLGGERLRLKGKGKVLPGGQRGEMYVSLSVRLPQKLGAAARSLDHISQLYPDSIRKDLKL